MLIENSKYRKFRHFTNLRLTTNYYNRSTKSLVSYTLYYPDYDTNYSKM